VERLGKAEWRESESISYFTYLIFKTLAVRYRPQSTRWSPRGLGVPGAVRVTTDCKWELLLLDCCW